MQKIFLAAAALCGLAIFSGCMDVREEVTISAAGSGTFTSHTDMGRGIAMIKRMSSQGAGVAPGTPPPAMFALFERPVDYTSALLALPDSFSTHLVADPERSVLTFDTRAYVNDLSGLQRMRALMTQQLEGIQYMLRGMIAKGRDSGKMGLDMMLKGGLLQTTWNPHQIKRTFNQALYDSLVGLKAMPMAMMAAMGQDGSYALVFHLPSPVRQIEGGPYTLSDDRKTVTFEKKFMDIFKDPKSLAFTIDY